MLGITTPNIEFGSVVKPLQLLVLFDHISEVVFRRLNQAAVTYRQRL